MSEFQMDTEAKYKFLKSDSFIIFSFNKLQYTPSQWEDRRLGKSSFSTVDSRPHLLRARLLYENYGNT